MKSNIEIIRINDWESWQAHFGQCEQTDLQQIWEYGHSVQNCVDWQPVRQLIQVDKKPVAIAQVLTKSVPVLGKVARIQHGPLFIGAFNPETARAALQKLRQYWVAEKQATLHLTPAVLAGTVPVDWFADCDLSPSDEVLWASVRVDLEQDAEKIRKKMHRKWRRSLQKAEEGGVEIRISDARADFDFFLEKYTEATREKGISWPSVELTRELWTQAHSRMHIFTAMKNNVKIAAMVPIVYANTAYALVAWNGPLSAEFHAHNFLIWQAILFYQKKQLKWFDLGGIDPKNLPGITKFKRNLGAEEYRFAGNFEARPDGALEAFAQADYRKGLGHILPGLELPGDEVKNSTDVAGKVLGIMSDFIRQATGYDGEIDADISLINGGLIDSLSLVSVIQSLQDAFDIEIGVTEITIDNFDTVNSISNLINSKLDY